MKFSNSCSNILSTSFGEGDCGIDIVALDENGEYIAIQCK
ncbi:hypothetical protein, partial [Campylobacter fetus]